MSPWDADDILVDGSGELDPASRVRNCVRFNPPAKIYIIKIILICILVVTVFTIFRGSLQEGQSQKKNKNFPDSRIFHAKTFWTKRVNRDIDKFATNVRKI